MMKERELQSLTDRFHTFNVFDGYHIRKDGALSAVWQLTELNLLRLTELDFESYSETIYGLLKSLPDRIQVQIIYDKYEQKVEDRSRQSVTSDNKEIIRLNQIRRRENGLKTYYHIDVFLIITFNNLLERYKPPGINDLFLFNPRRPGQLLKKKFESDVLVIKKLESIIESELAFLRPYRLNSQQIIRLLSNYYNLDNNTDRPLHVSNESFNSDLLYKNIAWDRSGIAIGMDKVLVFSLAELPSEIRNPITKDRFHKSPLTTFLDLPFRLRLVVAFEKLPQQAALNKVKWIKRANNGFTGINKLAERKIDEIEGWVDGSSGEVIFEGLEPMLQLGNDFLVNFSMTLFTWDREGERLREREIEILNKFEQFFSSKGVVENEDALPVFLSCAPGNHNNYRRVLLRGANAAHFINLCNHYKGMVSGISFFNLNDELVLYDLFSKENDNFNAIIIGPSGSGKSFLCSNIIHKYIEQGVPVAILDIGGSYRPLVELLRGDYIEINKEEPTYLDPLYYFNPRQFDAESPAYFDAIKFIASFIELMIIKSDQSQTELPKDQRAIFIQTIEKFLSTKKNDVTLYEFMDHLKADDEFLNSDQRFKEYVLHALHLYLYGTMRPYFEPGNKNKLKLTLDATFSLIAFDLRGIEDEKELLPLYAFMITKIIANVLERDLNRFIFIQDEAWKTLEASAAISKFTKYFYRTARKYNGSIISISQSIDDFTGDLASSIITNSDNKLLLKHRPEDVKKAVEIFGFSKAEEHTFRNLKRHEIFLSARGEPVILKANFSEYDYWLYTTDAEERSKREAVVNKNSGNLISSLSELAEEKEQVSK